MYSYIYIDLFWKNTAQNIYTVRDAQYRTPRGLPVDNALCANVVCAFETERRIYRALALRWRAFFVVSCSWRFLAVWVVDLLVVLKGRCRRAPHMCGVCVCNVCEEFDLAWNCRKGGDDEWIPNRARNATHICALRDGNDDGDLSQECVGQTSTHTYTHTRMGEYICSPSQVALQHFRMVRYGILLHTRRENMA